MQLINQGTITAEMGTVTKSVTLSKVKMPGRYWTKVKVLVSKRDLKIS